VITACRQGVEVLGVGWVDTVDDRLEAALDDGQRRAQLMRHVGQEASALLVTLFEAR
jgi:hypothetical protein